MEIRKCDLMRAESADTEISIMEEYVEGSIFTSKSTSIVYINIVIIHKRNL